MINDNDAIAIIGGTGRLGPAVALRLARAGRTVLIGSREVSRAEDSARELSAQLNAGQGSITGGDNRTVAARALSIVVTVPAEGIADLMPPLAAELVGKLVLSTVVPMAFVDKRARYAPPPQGSAALQVQELAPGAHVTAALHTVSSAELINPTTNLDADSLVCGDDAGAVEHTRSLVTLLGLRPVTYGALRYACDIEALTPLLLNLNRINRGSHTGVRITGLL